MAGQKKEARGRRKERGKGADRWGRSAAREKGRGRATRVKPSRPQRRAVARSGPQRSSSWAAESVRALRWPAGPRALRAGAGIKQRAQARQASGRRRGKRAGLAGPEGDFLLFFSNQMFIKFYFSPFSFLSQIQISFEYKFQIF